MGAPATVFSLLLRIPCTFSLHFASRPSRLGYREMQRQAGRQAASATASVMTLELSIGWRLSEGFKLVDPRGGGHGLCETFPVELLGEHAAGFLR